MKLIPNKRKLVMTVSVVTIIAALFVSCSNEAKKTATGNMNSSIEKNNSLNESTGTTANEDIKSKVNKEVQDFSEFEKQLKECVNTCDLDRLFNLADTRTLDAGAAESYGMSLYELYKKVEAKDFINKLSKANTSKTDEIISLLVGELPPKDKDKSGEINKFEKEFEKLKNDSSLNAKGTQLVNKILAKIKSVK